MELDKPNDKKDLIIVALTIALWRCCMFNESATRKYWSGGIKTAKQLSNHQKQRIVENLLSIL
jgi:hypothetical protein